MQARLVILQHADAIDSTQLWALRFFKKTQKASYDLYKFTAKQQTAGIGTKGRSWLSPAGGFYASYATFLDAMVVESIAAELAQKVTDFLLAIDIPCKLKKPNDILVNQQKLAGILAMQENLQGKWLLCIGIGINVEVAPNVADRDTASIGQFTDMTVLDVEQGIDQIIFQHLYTQHR